MIIFNINFLPARYGDSLWIEYGEEDRPNIILIDGGTGGTRKEIKELINELPEPKHIELLVVTHIDQDHIEGILNILEEETLGFTLGSIWFNGWNHLPDNDDVEFFGPVQGERLTASILKHQLNWNLHFDKKAVVIKEDGKLPEIDLKDGFKITLLSPTKSNLVKLKKFWKKEVEDANLKPGFGLQVEEITNEEIEVFGTGIEHPDIEELIKLPFEEDSSAANGSSIAFLAEFAGKKILLSGDSFPSIILHSLNKIEKGVIPIDLFKLSHHGSASNTSPALINKLDCKKFVISTNGSRYKHPDDVTIARLIKLSGNETELLFNYRTQFNDKWDDAILKMKHKYNTTYPDYNKEGLKIKLIE